MSEGHFAKEAIDEMVDCLTKEKYRGRLIVILAGYQEDIDKLLSVNRGLASRFTEEIVFPNLRPTECCDLLISLLKKKGVVLQSADDQALVTVFAQLSSVTGWGNARDVQTLAKKMTAKALKDMDDASPTSAISLDESVALEIMHEMLASSTARAQQGETANLNHPFVNNFLTQPPPGPQSPPPRTPIARPSTKTASRKASATPPSNPPPTSTEAANDDPRDPGVSDAVWRQLQKDKMAQRQAEKELEALKKREKEQEEATRRMEELARKRQLEAARLNDEARRRAELMRIQAAQERAKRDAEAARMKKLEEERRQEAQVQQKLRTMGICPAGYQWTKQSGGYRCSAGGHFMSNSQLGI